MRTSLLRLLPLAFVASVLLPSRPLVAQATQRDGDAGRARQRRPLAELPAPGGRTVVVTAPPGPDSLVLVTLDSAPTRALADSAGRVTLFRLAPATAREWGDRLTKAANARQATGTERLAEHHPLTPAAALLVAPETVDSATRFAIAVETADGVAGPSFSWRPDDLRGFARGLRHGAAQYAPLPGERSTSDPDRIFVEIEVDEPVVPHASSCHPRYPETHRRNGMTGEVLLQYVVRANGTVEPPSVKVLRSTDVAFTDAVLAAVPCMRFVPAIVQGQRVRQLVQQPFTFDIAR